MIGERIQRARQAAGLSLRELAVGVGVSAMAISKYERNQSAPSSKVLMSLAASLGVRVEYFFRSTSVDLIDVEFRKRSNLSGSDQQRVLGDVQEQLERWQELDEIFPQFQQQVFKVPPGVPKIIESGEDIEVAAAAVRTDWELGNNPVPSLIDTFEERGIRVVTTCFDGGKKFDGLSAKSGDRHVIAIGEDWPGDRQRFTLAHELGHLVLEGRWGEAFGSDKNREKACDRFAGAFIAPKEMVREFLGAKRTWLEPKELYHLKHEFGLSIAAWSYRARDLGILDKTTHGKYWGYLRKNGWHLKEPGKQYPSEQSLLLKIRVYRALAEDLLGESKAAELLGIPVSELRGWDMEAVLDATDQ